MEECEESGCSKPATRDWNGRKVCQDHYEQYKEQYEKQGSDIS